MTQSMNSCHVFASQPTRPSQVNTIRFVCVKVHEVNTCKGRKTLEPTNCLVCMVAHTDFLPYEERTTDFYVEAFLKQLKKNPRRSDADVTLKSEGGLFGSSVPSGRDRSTSFHISSSGSQGDQMGSSHDLPALWYASCDVCRTPVLFSSLLPLGYVSFRLF